jgi:predicted nucleotidyltransferase
LTLLELESIFSALNQSGVRYLIAGGIAVNIHGYQRATADLDIVIQLEKENILAALRVLGNLDYQSILPVKASDFANKEIRNSWIAEKNMQVFSMQSGKFPGTTIDIFVSHPFEFDSEYQRAYTSMLSDDIEIKVVTIETLIAMKSQAARPRDLDDVEHLKIIRNEIDNQ